MLSIKKQSHSGSHGVISLINLKLNTHPFQKQQSQNTDKKMEKSHTTQLVYRQWNEQLISTFMFENYFTSLYN